jgi:hypothetical protein
MNPIMPTISIRFDIEKIGSMSYNIYAWKILWQAMEPKDLVGAMFYEGDITATLTATMSGRGNVFCIAIQCSDASILDKAKAALGAHDVFRKVCASPMFVEGAECTADSTANSLTYVGRMDSIGLIGFACSARVALSEVRRERRP